jgi:TRAP-type mannitol/chloroaromatic compound transport system substrate-binding protein
MQAEYDAKNPAALRSLLGKGVKLHTFSKEILDACQKSAHDVMEDISSKNAKFKKIYEPWKRFRQDQNTWMSVAEDPMNEILIRMGRK